MALPEIKPAILRGKAAWRLNAASEIGSEVTSGKNENDNVIANLLKKLIVTDRQQLGEVMEA